MTSSKPSSEDEAKALEDAMRDFRLEWGFARSFRFEDLLRRWARFVEQVENGYTLGLDDFTQELALRDSLDDVLKKLPPGYQSKVDAWLEPWTHRFRFATREIHQPLLPIENAARFWWWRLPNLLQGELLEAVLTDQLI